jgi:hypothetical protein
MPTVPSQPPRPAVRRCRQRTVAVVVVVAVALTLAAGGAARAEANKDDLAVTVSKLNKKALDEYENLNFEEARKILKDALDFCHEAGLDQHPVTARTNIHLGVVVLTGFKQREAAAKYFRKALEIQPDIKMTKSLANPEIQAAFDEVVASIKNGTVVPPPVKVAPEAGVSHEPVTRALQGQKIPISATLEPSLTPDRVVLWFRGAGPDFASVDMTEATPGNYTAEIPTTATTGSQVSYFLEVQKGGQPVAAMGSRSDPLLVTLTSAAPPVGVLRPRSERPPVRAAEGGAPSFYLALSVGSGVGWATGAGEINSMHVADPAGFALAQVVHLGPELGYFLSPDLLLSVQARIQFVSGLTSQTCQGCASPPSTAVAAFARLTWFLGTDKLKPYLSGSVGGGRIRHVAEFPKYDDCGSGKTTCVDSIPAGAVLLGPGAGVAYSVTPGFAVVAGTNTQLGFPRFTFNVDLNAGVAAEF